MMRGSSPGRSPFRWRDWFPVQNGRATIAGAIISLVALSGIGIVRNIVATDPLPFIAQPPVLVPFGSPQEAPSGALQTVTLEQAAGMLFDSATVFVDSRAAEEYLAGHIEGALNLSSTNFEADLRRGEARLRGSSTIVVYCDGGACESSLQVARRLLDNNFRSVLVFTDGYPAWQAAGYPIRQGQESRT
jgi:rhodanese-related sulfurtransferase